MAVSSEVTPREVLNAGSVCAQAICAMHRIGTGSQAAIRDLQAELQEAARSSLLVLLNSMTIPGLTFSIPAASRTTFQQTPARPHCFNQPPWSDRAGSGFSLAVVTDACEISLGQAEKYSV